MTPEDSAIVICTLSLGKAPGVCPLISLLVQKPPGQHSPALTCLLLLSPSVIVIPGQTLAPHKRHWSHFHIERGFGVRKSSPSGPSLLKLCLWLTGHTAPLSCPLEMLPFPFLTEALAGPRPAGDKCRLVLAGHVLPGFGFFNCRVRRGREIREGSSLVASPIRDLERFSLNLTTLSTGEVYLWKWRWIPSRKHLC